MVTGPLLCHKEKKFELVFVDKNSIKAVKENSYREVIKPGRN